ncbi:hypothetical protein C7408_102362 [Paraburkholderia caballeronis]|uniref:Uncharacterized protein n=1 Tax=Paraburkholderia caballeronis TaxID=416943 RepID=A0A1H7LUU0_9BURK|nr:hypothetical protein C7403_102499 [Paraburkholderia caballeronis]PXX03971.1 hypothetical protein C7407_102499 [Paraburkholderia caballeronis]RAK04715.1 hypothetical protein C7409_102499 [Paraburkholderia caballeronis]TDV19617.1 hypothetical protein C7408_102362 [Paraburkholderia caballeronis]TDV22216.1 hypothetical protein C7406_101361 [Paraburkholderia caballeronis]
MTFSAIWGIVIGMAIMFGFSLYRYALAHERTPIR